MRKKCNKGQALIVMALVILIVLTIFAVTLTNLFTMESKWSVKQRRSTIAFYLAEAAIAHAAWKLSESEDVWYSALNGEIISGYDGNTIYSELSNGQYKIIISSGPGISEVTIRGIGRDDSIYEVRAIEAVYQKLQIPAAIWAGGKVEIKQGMIVHWGTVVSGNEMKLKGQAEDRYYPRKYAVGKIEGRDENSDEPNTDNLEYWAYDSGKIGQIPEIDFDYYAEKAKASRVPTPKKGTADPEGSGYFIDKAEFKDYVIESSTTVIYVNEDVKIEGDSFFDIEAMIVMDNIHIHSDGKEFEANIPAGAEWEYQHPNAQDVWNNNFDGQDTYHLTDCAFHGFLYAGSFNCSGGSNSFVGLVAASGEIKINTMTIYYDSDVDDSAEFIGIPIERTSWKEVLTQW